MIRIIYLLSFSSFAQSIDSALFISHQVRLEGCWQSKYYQFKYEIERNLGMEYKSRIRSSAPIFHLAIMDDKIVISWMELLGGGTNQEIVKLKNNKLILKNDTGQKIVYRRNFQCD